jgi:hypothetical protein
MSLHPIDVGAGEIEASRSTLHCLGWSEEIYLRLAQSYSVRILPFWPSAWAQVLGHNAATDFVLNVAHRNARQYLSLPEEVAFLRATANTRIYNGLECKITCQNSKVRGQDPPLLV